MFPKLMIGVYIFSAIGCCLGFKKFLWFLSCGYGFAVMLIGLFLFFVALFTHRMTFAIFLLTIELMIYGFRLGYFVIKRELFNKSYQKSLAKVLDNKKTSLFISVPLWIYLAFEYLMQTSAITYRIANNSQDNFFAFLGVIIMALSILGESIADKQKSQAKAINPKRFCDIGLYKYVRCPNYFSEIMFWIGVVISGIGSTSGKQWIIVLVGLVLIIFIMYDSAKRLEIKQEKNYGLDLEYQKYSDSVPLLIPFTKMYHSFKVYR